MLWFSCVTSYCHSVALTGQMAKAGANGSDRKCELSLWAGSLSGVPRMRRGWLRWWPGPGVHAVNHTSLSPRLN